MSGPAARRVPRSYLYVPGDQPDKLERAFTRGADALIVDLEDAVAPAAKTAARAAVAAWLRRLPADPGAEVWVRVNPGPAGHDDARAVVTPALTGVVAAKTETGEDLERLDAVLREAEAGGGDAVGVGAVEVGAVEVVPLLESAAALLRTAEIARAPRVRRLQAGEADLRADLGVSPGEDERELLYARSQLVLVSAACGLEPPVGPVSTDFRDPERLRSSTLALARLGFVGRACIHPAQVPIVNEVFTPEPAEVERARTLVTRFERARAQGSGVLVDDDGRMVDEAVIRAARRLLGRAR